MIDGTHSGPLSVSFEAWQPGNLVQLTIQLLRHSPTYLYDVGPYRQ
jgi:hypothetical protein